MILDYNNIVNNNGIEIKGIIHIGAFYGQEKTTYNNLNVNNVIWIEANPNYKEIIKNNVGEDLIIISGVGNKNEILDFNIANNGQSSSFLEFGTHLDEHPGINFTDKIKVPVKRMSDIVNEYSINIDDFNFLNIDIQGYELEALKGFDNLIHKFDYIYSEVNEKELYKGCPLINEIDDYLKTFGFQRVITNITGHGWGDALYIKNKI
jgi:FkbM family methyltransferase